MTTATIPMSSRITEILSGISDKELIDEIARISGLQKELSEEVKRLNRIRKLIGTTNVTEDTKQPKRRVPRGLFERVVGLFERSAGDKFTAASLANQLNMTAADIQLCIDRNASRFFKIGSEYGLRQVGK